MPVLVKTVRHRSARFACLRDGENELGLKNLRTFEGNQKLHLGLGEVTVRSLNGDVVQRFETSEETVEADCGGVIDEGYKLSDCADLLLTLPLVVPTDGDYAAEIEAWILEGGEKATTMRAWMPGPFHREGDAWYRDMRTPGFDDRLAPSAENSLQWLAQKIVADKRFADATVKFWWPAIMGNEVTEPPEDENDTDFEGQLLASNAQTAEINRLANGFRYGFQGRSQYNLKDLLVELVLSKWFRAGSLPDDDQILETALRDAGAKRLLTPAELARKTNAVTGFQWERWVNTGRAPPLDKKNALTDPEDGYRLLFGGIDSGGITDRARDITSIMAGVAESHAAESSCPIVLRELFLLPDGERRLFAGIDKSVSPTLEFNNTYEVKADSQSEAETLSLGGQLTAGTKTVSVTFVNDYFDDDTREDRNVRLDRLDVRDEQGQIVESHEFETLSGGDCGGPVDDHFKLSCSETLDVSVSVPEDGRYEIEIVAWADQAGNELAKVEITVGSDTEKSAGAEAIRNKLVALHEKLLGIQVDTRSADVETAYRLFIDVWERNRQLENTSFFEPSVCNFGSDHRYLDGILDGALKRMEDERGNYYYDWDWDRVNDFVRGEMNPRDPNGVARTWVVVLAYLLMDYRYLYL